MSSDLDNLFSKPVPKPRGRAKRLPQFKAEHKPLVGPELLEAQARAKASRDPLCVCGNKHCRIGPFLG